MRNAWASISDRAWTAIVLRNSLGAGQNLATERAVIAVCVGRYMVAWRGVWCVVCGVLSLVIGVGGGEGGVWCVVSCERCLVIGECCVVCGAWWVVCGAWCGGMECGGVVW